MVIISQNCSELSVKHITAINLIFLSLQLLSWCETMVGGLRGLVKHLRSSSAVFVYVLVLYFLLMIHQVTMAVPDCFHSGLAHQIIPIAS